MRTGTASSAPDAGLGQHAVERRAVPSRHDDTGGSEHGRRAQHRAGIVRVRHVIEENERRPVGGSAIELVERRLRQRLRFEQKALMYGIGTEHAVEVRG